MASSKAVVKSSSYLTECPICFEDYVNPKQLPCFHTFCSSCLEKYCDSLIEVNIPSCPVCRNKFSIPEGGSSGFITNDFIVRLVAEKILKNDQKEDSFCGLCLELGDEIPAASYCKECSYLCAKCAVRHSKQKLNKSHNVLDLRDKPSDAEKERPQNLYCTKHDREELKFHCCDCQLLICAICHVSEHNQHECKIVEEKVKVLKEAMKDDLKLTGKFRMKYKIQLDRLMKQRKDTLSEVSSTESSIRKRCQELRSLLSECEEELIAELNKNREKRLREIATYREVNEALYMRADSCIAYGEALLERGTDFEIAKVAENFHSRVEEFNKSNALQIKAIIKEKSLKFIEASNANGEIMKTLIGDWKLQDLQDQFLSIECTATFIQHTILITGIAVVDDEIFVVRRHQSQINVYDSQSLTALRDIYVPDIKSPLGFAGCPYNKALYISDSLLQCIHRVDLNNKSFICWKMRDNHWPRGLSVTAKYTLLVTLEIRFNRGESGIVEYTSEGQQLREIRFDGSIQYAWQTEQLSSDHQLFIVSHGLGSSLHRVCVIDTEGQIMSYSREKGGDEDSLWRPLSLAIDDNSKHIFVTDYYNHRVVLLDSGLTYLGRVHTPYDLKYPYQVYFDSSTDRLFVGEESGRLIVISPPT